MTRTFLAACLLMSITKLYAQEEVKLPVELAKFKWVNELPEGKYAGVEHGTYHSQAMNLEVGYCIYLPPQYHQQKEKEKRFPVVYQLHGGTPGGETKNVSLAAGFDEAMKAGKVPPMIVVFVNGGVVSHYDYPKYKSLGETTFIKELIPHIDAKYRTIAQRQGRALQGFSQGGRGTGRLMFKYPELFCSAAPLGGGHQHEKRISENQGDEGAFQFEVGHNTYDLARRYAEKKQPPLRIMIMVGDKDMNYEANLDWMKHLKSLDIPFEHEILPNVAHNSTLVFQQRGEKIMNFHAESFRQASK